MCYSLLLNAIEGIKVLLQILPREVHVLFCFVVGEVGRFVFDGPVVSHGVCLSWYFSLNMTQIKEEISKARACPCTGEQARLDGNFRYDENTNTASPWFGLKQLCEYNRWVYGSVFQSQLDLN